ncbi:uncharacterized protein [Mobula birostris]|uniref:uncharacterized protein isoform X2 n=1 Tax=Mobula birostris TaxID=1983395 RepID=UPI003B287A9B
MGNEGSSMGDQANKKKKVLIGGSRSSKYAKNEQNVNEEQTDVRRTGAAGGPANVNKARPAPNRLGDNIAVLAAQSASLDNESVPTHLQVKQDESIQATAGAVVPGPRLGESDGQCPETDAENNFSSTSQEILVGQRNSPSQCGDKANLQITTDLKSPLSAESENSLWSLLDDAVFEKDTLRVNNRVNETKTVWTTDTAQSLNSSSLSAEGETAASVAEDTLSDLLHHGEQLDEADEQGSYPSPQGIAGGDQLPAQETQTGLVWPVPGCKGSITEENRTKSTDGHSNLLIMETQDPTYLTPASLEKHAENVAIEGHSDVSHSRGKTGSVQLTAPVVTELKETYILPGVSNREGGGSTSVSRYTLNSSDGEALNRTELSLCCEMEQHQTCQDKEDNCSLLDNTGVPTSMELLSISTSDFDPAKLSVILLPVNGEQEKADSKEQVKSFTEGAFDFANRMENTMLPSVQHNLNIERASDELVALRCDHEQDQKCNLESKTVSSKGDLNSLEMQVENHVFPIIQQDLVALESTEKGSVSNSKEPICTSDSKGNVCEDIQETKSSLSVQVTPSEQPQDKPLDFCCDGIQQAQGSENPTTAPEDILSSVQGDTEEYSFPKTNTLARCQNSELAEEKEALQDFQNSQPACGAEKRDDRSVKSLETGQEDEPLSVSTGLLPGSQDSVLNEGKEGTLNPKFSVEKQANISKTKSEFCKELCLQKDLDVENKTLPTILQMTPSCQTPDTMVINEMLVLSIQQQQIDNSTPKENICKGNVHEEPPPNSCVPGTFTEEEAFSAATDNQQAPASKRLEEHSEEPQRNLQTMLESSNVPESKDLLLSHQDCDSIEPTARKLLDFSHFTEQTSACSAEIVCQEERSNIQMIKNIIIPAGLQLPAGLGVPGTAEVEESSKADSSEQTCSNESQGKKAERSECSPSATMEHTLLSEMGHLPLALQIIDSADAKGEQCLSHGNLLQATQAEIKAKPVREERGFQTDGQDVILERVESLPASRVAAGVGVKEVSPKLNGEPHVSEEWQKTTKANVSVLSANTDGELNSQDVPIKKKLTETFAHEQHYVCESEFKESSEKDSDSLQKPLEDVLISEATELSINPNAMEQKELLIQNGNKQWQPQCEVTEEKGCEGNFQSLLTDTEKAITRSMDLPPCLEKTNPSEFRETLFSLIEQQKQKDESEASNNSGPVDSQPNEELSTTTQNFGSMAPENEKLTLNYPDKQETMQGKMEASIFKEEVHSFQIDHGDATPEGIELRTVSDHPVGKGLRETLVTFTGENQKSCSETQQQDDEELQEGPEDTIPSISRGLAPNLEDATTETEVSLGSCHSAEQQLISDTEFKNGLPEQNLEQSQTPAENDNPLQTMDLSIDPEKPDVEEQNVPLPWVNRQQAENGTEEEFYDTDKVSLFSDSVNISAPEAWSSPASYQDDGRANLEETIIGSSNEYQCMDEKRKQGVAGDNIPCFPTIAENMENSLNLNIAASMKSLQDSSTIEMKEKLSSFDVNGKHQISTRGIEDDCGEENVGGFQKDEENTPEFTMIGLKDHYSHTELLRESSIHFDCDIGHRQTGGNATNCSAETMSGVPEDRKTSPPESTSMAQELSIPLETETPLGFIDEHNGPIEERTHEDEVCCVMSVSENVTSPPTMEVPASSEHYHKRQTKEEVPEFKKCSDEMKEEDIQGFQPIALDAPLETTELIPTVVTQETSEEKKILSDFIDEQQQFCNSEAKGHVYEENFWRHQAVKENIVLSKVPEQSPEEILLPVFSEEWESAADGMKNNASEGNIWSCQILTEDVVHTGALELTDKPQNLEGKEKETLNFCGNLKEEPVVKNDSNENIQQENMHVSKISIKDTEDLVNKQLAPCAQELKSAVLPETVKGLINEYQPENLDNINVEHANNFFSETINSMSHTQTPDVKDMKEVSALSSQLQMVCSCASEEEGVYGKSVQSSQNALENIIIPESMKLATAFQDSDISEPIVSTCDQGSSRMHTEASKGEDCTEDNSHPDNTTMIQLSPTKEDKIDCMEKLSDVNCISEQQKWNMSEINALDTKAEIATTSETIKLPPSLQIHKLDTENDHLLASTPEDDKNEINFRDLKEKIFEENASKLKMDGERKSSETSKLTLMPQKSEEVKVKETSVDFKNEKQEACNTEIKEATDRLIPTESVSAQETVELISNAQEFGIEDDKNKLLDFSLGTEQIMCKDETKISRENAFIVNTVDPESVTLLSSVDTGNEIQETENSCLSESHQLSVTETKANLNPENVHFPEAIIPEINKYASSSLHSEEIIKEDNLSQRYDSERHESLATSGKESVYTNSVGGMGQDVTFGKDSKMFPLCHMTFSEAVEMNNLLTTSTDNEQLQAYDSQISQSICEEKISLKVDFDQGNHEVPVAEEKETVPAECTGYKRHAASQETRLTDSMVIESKEASSIAEHLLLLHTRKSPESSLQNNADEQEYMMDIFPTECLTGVDQMPTKQKPLSNSELENDFLFEVEQTAGEGRSLKTLTDVKEDGFLLTPCANTEVRISEEGHNERLKSESSSTSISSSPSGLGKDGASITCTVAADALDKGIMSTSQSLTSEEDKSVSAPLVRPVAPCSLQHSEYTKPLDDAKVFQEHPEEIALSASLAPEKSESLPAPVPPSPSPLHTEPLRDAEALPKLLEQTLSTSEKEELVSNLIPVVPHSPQQPEYSKPLDDAGVLQKSFDQAPLSAPLASEEEESLPAFLLAPDTPHPPQDLECTTSLILPDHPEQTQISVSLTPEKEESIPAFHLAPVAPELSQLVEHTEALHEAEVLQDHLEQPPLSLPLASEEEEPFPAFLLAPVDPDPPQDSECAKSLDDAKILLNEQVSLSVPLTSEKGEPISVLLPVEAPSPQKPEQTKPLDDAEVLQPQREEFPLSVSLASEKGEPLQAFLLPATAPDPAQDSECTKPLDVVDFLQNDLEQLPIGVFSFGEEQGSLHPLFAVPVETNAEAVQESQEHFIDSSSVPSDIKNTDSELPVPAVNSSVQDNNILLQDDTEQSALSPSVPGDSEGQIDHLIPSTIPFPPPQSDGVDEPHTNTTNLQKEPKNTSSSEIAESILAPSLLTSNADALGVEVTLKSVAAPSDGEDIVGAPPAPAPLPLAVLQSDEKVEASIETSLQNQYASVSASCDSETPIDACFPSESPSLSPEGITKPQPDATDLQELVRSSDSEGAFETPEETTPVKVPPQLTPTAAEKESQEQLPSEDSVVFPDNQSVAAPENSPQQTDSFRPLSESASIVFDEDKPIASSGAYKIDFDSLDVLDSLTPSSPGKLEGPEPGRQANEKSLHTLTISSPPTPQSPPFSRKPAGTTDAGSTEDVAKTLQAEAFSIASDSAPSVKKKKPRPLSIKKKTKSEKPAEKPAETPAEKPTETPTTTEAQTRSTVPKTNKELNTAESSCTSLQSSTDLQESPIPHLAIGSDQANISELNPFASGDKLQTSPKAQSECENFPVALKELDKITTEAGTASDSPAVGHAVRLEFDYSEDKDNFETDPEKKPVPKKFGKKTGGKMPLRKPKLGTKKAPPAEKVDSIPSSYSSADPDDIPIPKSTYSFDPSKWDDPNFNPFSTNVQVPNSPKLPRASSSIDVDNCESSADPFKSSTNISGSPSHSPASFEVNDDTGASEGDSNNKSSKKKRLPLKTNTFRVKRSPKRTPLSETSSQDSTPLTTPETPPVIGTVEHATDEEKLASSVTNQKWSYSGIQSELEEDKPDYPQPSDLSAFVNENSEFANENFSSAVLGYEQSLEIEYMEKLGSSSPHHDTNAKKQSMYLKIDSLKESPINCPPVRLSVSATSCSGSSLDDVEDGVLSSAANKLSGTRPLAPSQEAHLHSPDKPKDGDSLSSSSAKSDMSTPEEPVASADALLSRIVGHTEVDELDYLQPDTAEKNPSVFASKLQEELVYAAMRIEALKLAKQISNSPSSSLDYEIRGRSAARRQRAISGSHSQQRDSTPLMDTPITKSALYSRTGDSEVEDSLADGHHYNQRDLDSALRAAREEIVEKEREAAEWKRKYDESKQEVVEMRRIVAEYEKTIAQMIEDDHREKSISHHTVQQLILEKDQALSDLNSVEKSLADLFRRYEKMKEVLEGFRKNEEVLKKCAQEYLARVKKEEQRYHALKIHAEEKLDKANAEIAQVRAKSKSEQTAFQASLRKEQMKVESLERTLEQKNKEVEELTKICDELIAKMGKS